MSFLNLQKGSDHLNDQFHFYKLQKCLSKGKRAKNILGKTLTPPRISSNSFSDRGVIVIFSRKLVLGKYGKFKTIIRKRDLTCFSVL